MAASLNPGIKKGYRVKGFLDNIEIQQAAMIPMGNGSFILPLNSELRKKIKKGKGARLRVTLSLDDSEVIMDADFLACLEDEPVAKEFFYKLPPSHRSYFSKWISSAKSDKTKAKRIILTVNGLSRRMNYGEMIRAEQDKRK